MSAESLTTAVTLFAGPGRARNSTSSVNGRASFHFVLEGKIQTLSTQNAPKDGPIRGLLFVPTLNGHDECNNTIAPYVPANVTRHQDVALFGYHIIGLAPWVTRECSQLFLDASRRVGTDALVFFLPSHNNHKPPPAHDATWLLNGEYSWKDENLFPVYAIPGQAGITLMEQLSWYSGNGTAPDRQNGTDASARGERWDVRLFTLIDLEKSGKKSPSIWGFLLAILGTIFVLCIVLLLLYQFIRKRRRQLLHRRLEAGGTDHERYDLQHIPVSEEFLAKLPIYIYPSLDDSSSGSLRRSLCTSSGHEQSEETRADEVERTRAEKEVKTEAEADPESRRVKLFGTTVENAPDTKQSTKLADAQVESIVRRPSYPKHTNRLSHSQTTCAICLEDYIPDSSVVRELPCGHIYHPECIDVSLTRNSSLCPLCKKSVLPAELYPISMPEVVHQDRMQAMELHSPA
ncbi:E3 ubiquitin-protein ligase RNF103 [Aspergillus lucknowensis]|uniref:RING-type domain-containing protein n=1 Tax=Aspergillus lucknowensis TaxID=176173 RepID=A0ABR4LWH3_9EURO